MSYLQIVQLIFSVLFTLLSLLMAHFVIFAVVGAFARKRYPKTDKINKYGMIIPARNEEKVVAGLIESIQKNNYPQDKLTIFVIAHNCTDRTAEIARQHGATVYEYNNPDECTMGYAFKYLFSCIERDFGTASFDGFFMFIQIEIFSRLLCVSLERTDTGGDHGAHRGAGAVGEAEISLETRQKRR